MEWGGLEFKSLVA